MTGSERVRTTEETSAAETTYPDIERCANSLLAQATVYHPALAAWVKRVTNEPDFTTYLSEFEIPARAIQQCASGGFSLRTTYHTLSYLITDHKAHPNHVDAGARSAAFARSSDEAILSLAGAVVLFRREGRPAGEQDRALRGLGGELAIERTSLAAAVVAFHDKMVGAYADELADR